MQNWYKNIFIDWTRAISSSLYADLNCFVEPWLHEPELLASEVCLCTPSATEQTYCVWKPIDTKLDMCVWYANVQKHQFSNLPAF